MKASALAAKLEALIKEHGDCDIVFSQIEDGVYPFLQEVYWSDDAQDCQEGVFFISNDERDRDDYEEPPWGYVEDGGLCTNCDWPTTKNFGNNHCNRCNGPEL